MTVCNLTNDSCYWITPDHNFKHSYLDRTEMGPRFGLRYEETSIFPQIKVSEISQTKDSTSNNFQFRKIIKIAIYKQDKEVTKITNKTYLREKEIPNELKKGMSSLFKLEYLPYCKDSSLFFLTKYHAIDTFENTSLTIENSILDVQDIEIKENSHFDNRIDSLLLNAKSVSREEFIEINGPKE